MQLRERVKTVAKQVLVRSTRGKMMWRGPSDARRVAITFDDGPGELTEAYLETLADLGVPATFFIMGYYVEQEHLPGAVGKYLRGGHQVAGHGFFHQRFTEMGARALRSELDRMHRALGVLPWGKWVRPPHGSFGPRDVAVMLALDYTVAMWSFDSCDYDGATADVLVERCRPERITPGEVMLFHEANHQTLAALPAIVRNLQADGYELVTMADLLSD